VHTQESSLLDRPQVVLGDANVLYARVLRDYLLHAASAGAISIIWSDGILDEAIDHLKENVVGFDEESGTLLKRLMNEAYPLAQIDPTPEDFSCLDGIVLPDEKDRHVLAAALAAEADILCTVNIKDFPKEATLPFGIITLKPDELFSSLIDKCPDKMLIAHERTIKRLRGATDSSTLEALSKAGVPATAKAMKELLKL